MDVSKKKDRVLKSALALFAKKGFSDTSISEIAEVAGMKQTAIYRLFAGKEDVLFNIPVEKTNEIIESLLDHLEGLKGAENKLRKAIWHYLNFQENNKDYASVIVFELRVNRRFYKSEAYNSFRNYSKIIVDILKEGVDEGVFKKSVNINHIRNMIFGSFDHLTFGWLLFNKPKSIVAFADGLFALVYDAIKAKKIDKSASANMGEEGEWIIDKRWLILRVAESIFAKKGYDKTRISDISNALNIGDATLYEYFKNKEDILFTIPSERSKYLMDSLEDELNRKQEAELKLRRFVRHYLAFLQANEDYSSILLFELRANKKFYESRAYQDFRKFNRILFGILKLGQEEGVFQTNTDISLCRHMIFGTIDHTVLGWLLFRKPLNLLDQEESLSSIFLDCLNARIS
ncbi:MAG: TetR/AcrR family transcriptional regulator C-terminal domain-containing protein [Thermodesulfobacteriota bacterium]